MIFDYSAALDDQTHVFDEQGRVWNLASGFVDRAATDLASRKAAKATENEAEKARRYYRDNVPQLLTLPPLDLDTGWKPTLPGWFSLSVHFELCTPWYSKDDRPFHVLDNPVRKDRVFGVPFMSAASWKGLLRWACRMEAEPSLLAHLAEHNNKLDDWSEPDWIIHLFGNEQSEDENFIRGALAFRPTWFDRVDFELINPHDRERRAGTQPIMYEVVPGRRVDSTIVPGTQGILRLLYAPIPGSFQAPPDTFKNLFRAIEKLLQEYGFSAKRTSGWGVAQIKGWHLVGIGQEADPIRNAEEAANQVDNVRFAGGRS